GQCFFSDLHSTNGTYLNGEPVADGTLTPGCSLRCGTTEFTVECDDAAAGGSAADVPRMTETTRRQKSATGTAPPSKPADASAAAVPKPLPADVTVTKGFVAAGSSEVLQRFKLTEAIAAAPKDDTETPAEFARRLLKEGEPNDCLDFLARALPKRLGVWWAVQCIESADAQTKSIDNDILAAVRRWITKPTDDSRRAAMNLAQESGMETAAAWAAVGAFWSHGSMGPVGQPDVPAADEMAGKAVAGAVILASVCREPEKAPQRRADFVELAERIAAEQIPLPQ
ncbi:MAG: hypothetical protein KDA89_10270, partial [Planctomycetaceae bacterium]|nr:hypothetical protein [Planctomycetaceae bacterium]